MLLAKVNGAGGGLQIITFRLHKGRNESVNGCNLGLGGKWYKQKKPSSRKDGPFFIYFEMRRSN